MIKSNIVGKRYFVEIDSLRFFAFLFTLINHTGICKYVGGTVFFFTLSGFLISYSTFNKINSVGRFSLKRYWIKRSLRIFPLYYIIVFGCGIVYGTCRMFGLSFSFSNYWSFLIFLQNYFGYNTIFILTNLWAIAVLEQLYLGWSILTYWYQGKLANNIFPLALFFIIAAFIIRNNEFVHYANTLNYIGVYLLEAGFGSIYYSKNVLYRFITSLSKFSSTLLFCIGLLLIILGFGFAYKSEYLMIRITLLSLGFCIVLQVLCYSDFRNKTLFTNSIFCYLGKISYGLYCYHAIGLLVVSKMQIFYNIKMANFILFSTFLYYSHFNN